MEPAELAGLPETIEEQLEGPTPVRCVAFSPAGTLLAGGCEGGELVVWDMQTRGVARVWATGEAAEAAPVEGGGAAAAQAAPPAPDAVTAVLWVDGGHTLLAGTAAGRLHVWDVPAGRRARGALALPCGGAAVRSLEATPAAARARGLPAAVLACFARGPALLLDLGVCGAPGAPPPRARALPVVSAEGEGRGLRVTAAPGGAPGAPPPAAVAADGAGQAAALGAGGALVYAAARGLVAAVRAADLAVLDVCALEGLPRVARLEASRCGGRLLVEARDRLVRVLEVPGAVGGSEPAPLPLDAQPALDLGALAALPPHALPRCDGDGGSLARGAAAAKRAGAGAGAGAALPPLLAPWRRLSAPVERLCWGAASLSPDGAHVVAAADAPDEHLLYTWSAAHGHAEATLQGGCRDGAGALAWHPAAAPAQLLALGRSGRAYLWARIFSQSWAAFAPDFEELSENREHEEAEDEFDLNPRPEPGAPAAGAAEGAGSDGDFEPYEGAPGGGAAPELRGLLLHLPVQWAADGGGEAAGGDAKRQRLE